MKIAFFLLQLLSFVSIAQSQIINVYVSPKGNDKNDGLSAAAPLATLQNAVDITGVLRKNRKVTGTINIQLSGGTYQLAKPVIIGLEVSGTSKSLLIIRSADNQQAKFRGAIN